MTTTPEDLRSAKLRFLEVVESPGHELIAAARTLRLLYRSQNADEQQQLIQWVRSASDLAGFVSGSDTAYYVGVAIRKHDLHRAQLEHLQRYSSDEIAEIEAIFKDEDEYALKIWLSEWRQAATFLTEFDIPFRIID